MLNTNGHRNSHQTRKKTGLQLDYLLLVSNKKKIHKQTLSNKKETSIELAMASFLSQFKKRSTLNDSLTTNLWMFLCLLAILYILRTFPTHMFENICTSHKRDYEHIHNENHYSHAHITKLHNIDSKDNHLIQKKKRKIAQFIRLLNIRNW